MIRQSISILCDASERLGATFAHMIRWQIFKRNLGNKSLDKTTVISMASYKKRLRYLELSVQSLLLQKNKDLVEIVVVVEDEEISEFSRITELYSRYHVRVISNNQNLRSYNKYHISQVKDYADKIIITADDDLIYDGNWLKNLLDMHKTNPNYVIGVRGKFVPAEKTSFLNYDKWESILGIKQDTRIMLNSGAGVLYPRNTLSNFLNNVIEIKSIAPTSDDLYLWQFLFISGACISINFQKEIVPWPFSQKLGLWKSNNCDNGNNLALHKIYKSKGHLLGVTGE